jgi:hypothetical protein
MIIAQAAIMRYVRRAIQTVLDCIPRPEIKLTQHPRFIVKALA